MTKAALRTATRAARKAYVAGLSPTERQIFEVQLANHLRPLVQEAGEVGGYYAVGSEIDPSAVLALASGPSLPAFEGDRLAFRFRRGPATVKGPRDIPQPGFEAPVAACKLVLVPLLAIDPVGNRLGQGGGHYDRALPALRDSGALLIGLGWEMQRLGFRMPSDPWDVPLDGFASPAGVEMFR